MASTKLTKRVVDNATTRQDKKGITRQNLYFDATLKGFGLCAGVRSKTFFVQRDINKKTVRVTIGPYGVFTVDQARKEAQLLIARMLKGENPNETRKKKHIRGITLKTAFDLYKATLATKGRANSTIKGYQYCIDNYLDDWLNKPLIEISREDARNRHQQIAQDIGAGKYAKERTRSKGDGQYTANGAMRVFRAVYNRAMKQHEELPANPCINIDWFPEKRREAAIPINKLADWYKEVMEMDNTIRRDYLRVVLFTGLRRQNAAEIKLEHINLKNGTLHIPKPKSQRPFDLPLSDFLIDIIKERIKENELMFPGTTWLFPAFSKSGHISEPKVEFKTPFTIHGLRNTFITVADSIDVSTYAIKLLVNHSLPRQDVTAGYINHEVERLRAPMQQITLRLLNLVTPQNDKVVSISAGKNK